MKEVYYLYAMVLFLTVHIFIHVRKKIIIGWRMRKIDKCSGTEFEEYLYYRFKQMGYKVRHTGKSGDYGADLILYSKKPKEKIVVQAKRYNQKVGQEAVREAVAATAYYNADRAIVVTNSRFTDFAKKLAKSNGVELYDREWLYKVVEKKLNIMTEPEKENIRSVEFVYKCQIETGEAAVDIDMLNKEIDEYLFDKGYDVTHVKERGNTSNGKGKKHCAETETIKENQC